MLKAEDLATVTAPLALAKTLPPEAYTSEAIFGVELNNLFLNYDHTAFLFILQE